MSVARVSTSVLSFVRYLKFSALTIYQGKRTRLFCPDEVSVKLSNVTYIGYACTPRIDDSIFCSLSNLFAAHIFCFSHQF